jgi:hypothetical protein
MIGRLARATLGSGTVATLYTVPADTIACVDVSFILPPSLSSNTDVSFWVSLTAAAFLPNDEDLFALFQLLQTNFSTRNVRINGLLLRADQKIAARSTVAGVMVSVHGAEDAA